MQSIFRRIGLARPMAAALAVCIGFASLPLAQAMPGDASAWGARNPGACPSISLKGAPTVAQVTGMLRCKHEVIQSAGGELWLMQNLKVAVGGPIPFVTAYNSYVMPEADVRVRTFPIRGSRTWSICKTRHDAGIYGNPDLNCYETDVAAAKGVCWKTTFGDWKCLLTGSASGRRDPTRPPPRGSPVRGR